MRSHLRPVGGPQLIALFSTLILAGVMLTLWAIPDAEQAWRSAVRFTARTSALLFMMAFGAAAAAKIWPGSFTYWMRKNRRYLGLSFAVSHAIHAYTFLSLAGLSPALSQQLLQPDKQLAQIAGYIFIFSLAATSSNWAQNKLGMRWWGRLHFVGTHYIWLLFLIGFYKHAAEHPEDWIGVLIAVVVMALRIGVRLQSRIMPKRL